MERMCLDDSTSVSAALFCKPPLLLATDKDNPFFKKNLFRFK